MTWQQRDRIYYWDGEEYEIVDVAGDWLLNAADLGVPVTAISSDCWRGFLVEYHVGTHLTVMHVTVGLKDEHKHFPPAPFGLRFTPRPGRWGGWTYSAINARTTFSGALLIARGRCHSCRMVVERAPYVAAIRYERAVELHFENGELVDSRNLTATLSELHERAGCSRVRDDYRIRYEVPDSDLPNFELDYRHPLYGEPPPRVKPFLRGRS